MRKNGWEQPEKSTGNVRLNKGKISESQEPGARSHNVSKSKCLKIRDRTEKVCTTTDSIGQFASRSEQCRTLHILKQANRY
jgi:hypothetical protein